MDLKMAVNGTDTTDYNARLLSRTIGLGTVTVYDDWLKNAMNPLYFGDQVTYKTIKLSFLIKDMNDNSALTDISNLVSAMRKCTIEFGDMDYLYDCVLQETGEPTKSILDGRFKLDVTLKAAYAYLPAVSKSYTVTFDGNKDKSISVNIQGNLPVPIVLEAEIISADSDQNFKFNVPSNVDTSTNGWLKNCFIIRPLYKNMTLTVDSEKCLVYEGDIIPGNAYSIFWGDFVTLQPGSNSVPVGLESLNGTVEIQLTIKYKPRFI